MKTSDHLAQKIRTDLALLKQTPDSDYLAFNVVISVAHWPEWHFPDEEAVAFRNRHEPFRRCDFLAQGGKHFIPDRVKKAWRQNPQTASGNSAVLLPVDCARRSPLEPTCPTGDGSCTLSLAGVEWSIIETVQRAVEIIDQYCPPPVET